MHFILILVLSKFEFFTSYFGFCLALIFLYVLRLAQNLIWFGHWKVLWLLWSFDLKGYLSNDHGDDS